MNDESTDNDNEDELREEAEAAWENDLRSRSEQQRMDFYDQHDADRDEWVQMQMEDWEAGLNDEREEYIERYLENALDGGDQDD